MKKCGGRVLLQGRGDHQGQGRSDCCSRDWIAVELKRTDHFVHRVECGQVVSFTKRLWSHETRSDSRVVVAGGSVVSETGGQQDAWKGESSVSLDEVFGPSDHLEALESSAFQWRDFFFETASGRELTLRPRRGVGNAPWILQKLLLREPDGDPFSSSDDTQVVVKLHLGKHARTQEEVTVSPSFAVCVFVVQFFFRQFSEVESAWLLVLMMV